MSSITAAGADKLAVWAETVRAKDMLDHGHLRQLIRQRVRDGVLLRLIDKWLKATRYASQSG